MSILNSLTLLEEGASGAFAPGELVGIARRNAERLRQTLTALLDWSAIESGVFRLKLREVDLQRLVETRLEAHRGVLRDQGIRLLLETPHAPSPELAAGARSVLLADPQKLGRAIELALEALLGRIQKGSELRVRVGRGRVEFGFTLQPALKTRFEAAWREAQVGPAFAEARGTEREFLTRDEEGLGSEFPLLLQIVKLHQGRVTLIESRRSAGVDGLVLEVPELSSEEGLMAVLGSRAFEASNELSAVALGLIEVPRISAHHEPDEAEVEAFRVRVQGHLFRASDAVYALPSRRQVALVLDDCKPEDAPRLLERIQKSMGQVLRYGVAACPSEGIDPAHLMELAARRLDHGRR